VTGIGIDQIGAAQIRSLENGVAEVRLLEVGLDEVGSAKLTAREDRFAQVGVGKRNPAQAR
jgi:hypothetical protein